MDGYIMSPEMRKYNHFNICPKCHKFGGVSINRPDGTSIRFRRDSQAIVTCKRCLQSWNMYVPLGQLPTAMAVKEIVDTVRTEEPIGDEVRKIDNSGTSTSSLRRLRVSRRWAQKCEIQIERATTTTKGLKFKGVGDLMGYESILEAAVRKNYAMSTEEEQTFEEEIEFTVPPRTMIELRLRWKRLWQEGYIVLGDQAGQAINIPFRSAIRITCDQESVDV